MRERIGTTDRLTDVRDWVVDRAELTPGLIAFRFAGKPITYAAFADALEAQVAIVEGHGFGADAGIIAALIECAPEVLDAGGSGEIAATIDDVFRWLSRHFDDRDDGPTHLRAIS